MPITIANLDRVNYPAILEVEFNNQNEFMMTMTFVDNESALSFRRWVKGLKGLHEMDAPSLHFVILPNENNNKLKLIGNIYNALRLLRIESLIGASLFHSIMDEPTAFHILSQSESYTLPPYTNFFNRPAALSAGLDPEEDELVADPELETMEQDPLMGDVPAKRMRFS